jgi:hypothetical protein
MNTACPRRVSLITALDLPTILSPTIGATTGDRPVVPETLKWYEFSVHGGAELKQQAFACSDCAMVWTMAASLAVLRRVVKRHTENQ